MGEEVKNNENKKKQKVAILIGVVTLLIAVLGATYAYFQIGTDTESSNTNITGSTPANGLVTLIPGTSNLHLNISASDMSQANANNEYYGTDAEEKAYEDSESDGTKTIAQVELTGGEETTKYSCTAKLTVSKVTEEDPDTMIDVLHSGDMILQFKGNIISEQLDLSDLKTTGSKEYNLSFKITGNTLEEIQAYIKLVNKEENQNYLAGKKLNIDINTSELKCDIYIENPKITQLRENDSQRYLSEELQGGMYRYQASFPDGDSSEMTNWICFGTTEKSECTNEDTGIDKYMYRIIGITNEGQMYLLKETFLKEGDVIEFARNSKSDLPDCLGEACEWPNVELYKRINGLSNGKTPGYGREPDYIGDTDIFVDSSEYDYLKSGDENGTNDGIGNDWYQLIANHNWMYGDTNEYNTANSYNGDYMYAIETGTTATKRYWPDEETQTTCGSSSPCTEKAYTWSKSTNAKIGLMYMHDVDYAYKKGNPENGSNIKNSWIHFQKDGYNNLSSSSRYYEWLISRYGNYDSTHVGVLALGIINNGELGGNRISNLSGIRPVFYLSSEAKIKDGDGTKANPYILDVQE